MTQDDIRDIAINVTVHLLDNHSYLLAYDTLEKEGEYTDDTFELQDAIAEAIENHFKLRPLKLPSLK